MKKMILSTIVLFAATFAQASSINSEKLSIAPSSIDKVIRLVDKNDNGGQKKLSIIAADRGMSTDISPRYTIYLGYQSNAEMGNISADFKISDQAMSLVSATRKSAGIYEVKTIEYRDEAGMVEVTQLIDATKLFSDEKKVREACGSDFCDQELVTSVEVKETAKSK